PEDMLNYSLSPRPPLSNGGFFVSCCSGAGESMHEHIQYNTPFASTCDSGLRNRLRGLGFDLSGHSGRSRNTATVSVRRSALFDGRRCTAPAAVVAQGPAAQCGAMA